MGRQKKNAEETLESAIDIADSSVALDEQITKKYGNNAVWSGADLINEQKEIISVSPALDIALGGGIPKGSWVTVVGPPKYGKTVLSLQLAANAQKKGMKTRYDNVEHRIKKRDIMGIKGLDTSPEMFKMFQSSEEHILSAEEHLDILEQYLMNESETVVIVDSVSALLTQKEKTSNISEQQRADGAKLMAKFCRQMASVVAVRRHIVITIAHIIANPSGYGSPFQESGGNKINFQSDVKIRAKKSDAWEAGGVQIGQKVEWQVLWSALGSPGTQATGYLRYGKGLDREYETMVMAIDANIAKQKGAWIDYNDEKFNGAEKFYASLLDNPELYNKLESEVKAMYGL